MPPWDMHAMIAPERRPMEKSSDDLAVETLATAMARFQATEGAE